MRLEPLSDESENVYTAVGGLQWFHDLCDRFYERVANDALLRPLYPEDLEPSRYWLALFLAQYWGGPSDYSLQRGHPRLRMRHMYFRVGSAERDRWYEHMAAALSETQVSATIEEQMLEYFAMAANHLINTTD